MAHNTDRSRIRWWSTGILAAAAVTTAGVFGGLLWTGTNESAAAATRTVAPESTTTVDPGSGWQSTPPLRNGGSSAHAGSGAS